MKAVKIELWKAFHNKMFFFALLVGMILSMINVSENFPIVQENTAWIINVIEKGKPYSKSFMACSLFLNWIAVKLNSFGHSAFYFVWPILAAMPYGWSYSRERRSGIYNQFVSRSNPKIYYFSKFAAVFTSGGAAVAIPVLMNLMINALICPYDVPNIMNLQNVIADGRFLSSLYYTYPWIHGLIWCIMDFLWGGAAACLCFIVGTKLRLSVLVTLIPFAILALIDGLCTTLYSTFQGCFELSPLKLAAAATTNPNPEWIVFTALSVVLVTGFTIGYWQVVKHELV